MIWSRPMQLRLEDLASRGLTGREIADMMRLTRAQVMGFAGRNDISVGAGETKSDRTKRGMKYRALAQQAAA